MSTATAYPRLAATLRDQLGAEEPIEALISSAQAIVLSTPADDEDAALVAEITRLKADTSGSEARLLGLLGTLAREIRGDAPAQSTSNEDTWVPPASHLSKSLPTDADCPKLAGFVGSMRSTDNY